MPLRARKNKNISNSLLTVPKRSLLSVLNKLYRGLCIRSLRCGIGEHIALGYSDNHATCHLDIDSVLLGIDTLYCAIYTATSHYLVAFLQRILELANLLLFLLLWTNHKQPHDSEDSYHHNEHRQATLAATALQK